MGESVWVTFRAKTPTCWNRPEPDAMPRILWGISATLYDGDIDEDVRDDGSSIWTIQGLGSYGSCAIEEFFGDLTEAGVPFEHIDEPRYDFDGEHNVFDGREWHIRISDSDGSPTINQGWWNERLKEAESWHPPEPWLVEQVNRYFTLPDIEECSIEHLPEIDPTDEDALAEAEQSVSWGLVL